MPDDDTFNRGGDEESVPAGGFRYVAPEPKTIGDAVESPRHAFTLLTTLPGYIWKELAKGVLLATAIFSVILMAVFAGQVMKDGVGAYTLARVLPNFIPLLCPFVLPLAIITGILICYSRLSRDNEIMAAYAGGIHPGWLMLPAILTASIAIFITLTLNEVALLPAIKNIERLVLDDQAEILMRMMTKPGNITVPTGDEYVSMSRLDPERDPQGRSSLDITRFSAPGGKEAGNWDPRYPYPSKRVTARDHAIRDLTEDNINKLLIMRMAIVKPVFQDLHDTDINKTFIASGESGEERIPLGGRPSVSIHSNRSSFWPILTLLDKRQEAEERLAEIRSSPEKLEALPAAQRASTLADAQRLIKTIRTRTAELNLRLALCFSCLAFAILGIPLGMRTKGSVANSFIVGIVVAGIFFLALKSLESQVARDFLPYWVIWIPDVLVVVLGVFLLTRNRVSD